MEGPPPAGPPPAGPGRRCLALLANGTACSEPLGLFPPLSSGLALLLLLAALAGVVLVSMVTFHLHKRRLRDRKMRRAQEEYERDSRSPARGAASGVPARPCVIIRPERREEEVRRRPEEDEEEVRSRREEEEESKHEERLASPDGEERREAAAARDC